MASVTVTKHTTQSAGRGQCAHLYRENANYSNKDINPDLTPYNIYFGSASQARKQIHDTIKQIDSICPPRRVRADRKTVAELNVPAPREGMSRDDEIRFLQAFYKALQEEYHVVGGAIHADECHSYIDPANKQLHQSRTHLQVLVVPETEKGLNMKSWLTRQRFRDINALADRVCMQELGFSYQDGSGQRSRGKVEDLKVKSALEAARQLPDLQRQVAQAQHEKRVEEAFATEQKQIFEKAFLEAQEAEAVRQRAQEATQAAQTKLKEAQARLSAVELKAAQADFSASQAEHKAIKAEKQEKKSLAEVEKLTAQLNSLKIDIQQSENLLSAITEKDTLTSDEFVQDFLDSITFGDGSSVWDRLSEALQEREVRQQMFRQWDELER